MRWVKLNQNNQDIYGLLQEDKIQLTNQTWSDILQNNGSAVESTGEIGADDVALLNPISRPGKIVCIGLNYLDHCRETNIPPPERPLIFCKFVTSLSDPNSDIVWSPELSTQVDWEAELAVIIGKTGRNIAEDESMDYVAGYTTANDVSARDVQLGDGQWIRGKSLDTFCPLGPVFVTADEIEDPQKLAIRSILNGQTMQDSNTSEMIFTVKQLIAFCSQAFTLEAGDVILTGTPHGVGLGLDPQVYMHDGDVIEIEIEQIGRLVNTCKEI